MTEIEFPSRKPPYIGAPEVLPDVCRQSSQPLLFSDSHRRWQNELCIGEMDREEMLHAFRKGPYTCLDRVSGLQPSVAAGESYGKYPKERVDGWLEIELGEFNSENGGDGKLKINLQVKGDHWKSGISVQGIEIRPKGD
ncbi:hypothetical protein GH714_016979 [Hevea brasiliensis]|uniref:F-box domain-containing protein n=1 Tax=Hevea brasiliensis TaxID=3981 RepID=A0A6A6N2C8_HEVBR|nr:hypothetical protein GH714_016979 [Hevea brasiliensis]